MGKLVEGDIIELKEGHKVYADIEERLVFSNTPKSNKKVHHEVVLNKSHSNLIGKYVVYKTAFEGGGTGMGDHDIFPDGWHVYCEKLTNPFIKVDFYQSGCFTAVIEKIEPVGKALRKWIVKK
jgi:hypothetical protein